MDYLRLAFWGFVFVACAAALAGLGYWHRVALQALLEHGWPDAASLKVHGLLAVDLILGGSYLACLAITGRWNDPA